ncbi:MAG: tRNA pseudouridine(55) synthase TruB [Pseudomonadota bacterium]
MPKTLIDGVLLLDKPAGWTSNAALQKAKRLFNAAKAGHTGTLDPFASGLLPVCFGQATKFSSHALHGDKTYRAILKLGITTTTGDVEGDALETRPVEVKLETVLRLLPKFTGPLLQTPPMYSALKHQGRPLYEYARAGIEIERKPREVTIYSLDAERMAEDELTISVRCSGGTYIRTLAEDIGRALGCGAHLIALTRTGSGEFSLNQAVGLEALENMNERQRMASLLKPDALVAHLPRLDVDADTALWLLQGKHPAKPAGCPFQGMARVYAPQGFLGLVEVGEKLVPARLMACPTA